MLVAKKMKVVKVQIDVVLGDDTCYDKDSIIDFLNFKLCYDSEWFTFRSKDIVEIKDYESC